MRLCTGLAVSFLAACATPPAAPTATPTPATAATARPPAAGCTVEGDGQPLDSTTFLDKEIELSATRGGAPVIRTQAKARFELHGRWSEIGADDRARLALSRTGALRVEGYATLSSVRFRLRREIAVVPQHVFLEKDALVRIVGAADTTLDIAADVPFDSPKSLAARVACGDIGYEAVEEKYTEKDTDTTGHLGTLRLFDAPRGSLRFEGAVSLIFVREGEKKDGFVHIEGKRHRVRVAGWTPSELVEHDAQGSGYGAGGRRFSGGRAKGRSTTVSRATPLFARTGSDEATPLKMGELPLGAKVVVTKEGTELVPISLADVVAVDDAALLVRAQDLE